MLKNQQVSECDNMKLLKDIENQAININGMSIMKAFFVLVLSVLLELLGQIPIGILSLFYKQFTNIEIYAKTLKIIGLPCCLLPYNYL